ncbi:MAG TPA: CDP-alcohol phosphatidyltransferase family protein [Anaerolineales bacterium]
MSTITEKKTATSRSLRMGDISKHERVNDILLGPLERPALRWLAAHLPAWVTPDVCTAIGVVGAAGILISYALSNLNHNYLWLASFFFVVNWFGDSLDGTLARFRHVERPVYGFFLDHTVDAIVEVMIFLGMGLSPHISYLSASLALIGYLLLSVLVYVRTSVVGEFKISYGRLGPTEIRVLAILLNVWMFYGGVRVWAATLPGGFHVAISPYDVVMGVIALLLYSFFIHTGLREAIALGREGK